MQEMSTSRQVNHGDANQDQDHDQSHDQDHDYDHFKGWQQQWRDRASDVIGQSLALTVNWTEA